MSQFFIDRPIFATVVSIVILIVGGVALIGMPVAQYPEIVPPTVSIQTVYPGAGAQVVADTVTTPIEQEVNGVEDMLFMASKSTTDGQSVIDVTFNLGTLNITSGESIINFGGTSTLNLGALIIADGASIRVDNWASFQDLWTTASFEGGDGMVSLDVRDDNTAQITFTGFSASQTIWLTEDFGKNEITVPEPSSYGAILMAFGLAAWRLRRPRRSGAPQ